MVITICPTQERGFMLLDVLDGITFALVIKGESCYHVSRMMIDIISDVK